MRGRGTQWAVVVVAVTGLLGSVTPLSGQGDADHSEPGTSTTPRDDGRVEFVVERAAAEIDVDGRLDDEGWTRARVIPLPYESDPGDNTPAPVDTKCYVTFDESTLYLACRASDPEPDLIRAFITDRDDIDGHDRVIFTLDPFNDARRAFEFGVSALGVQSDAVFNPQGSAQDGGGGSGGARDDSWDAIWASAGRIDEDGYTVEAGVPFKSLRFPSAEGVQSWGFFVSRRWPRSEAVETRSMALDRSNACELCQANLITGLRDIAPGRNLELTPAVVAGRTDRRPAAGASFENGSPVSELSLDALWGVTSNLTLNLTLNPDFSQVEADAPQLDVNNRFALFFPEKRSFFLEGGDFFTTPLRALFTRTIVSPDVGAKLTGKAGANVLGVIVARDEEPGLILPGAQGSTATDLDMRVLTGVGRLRHDFGASNNVGMIAVAREGTAYHNRLVGADAVVRPLHSWTARAQLLHSETSYPATVSQEHAQPDGRFGGNAGKLELTYSTRDWWARGSVDHLSDGFRADAGFVNQVGVNRANVWMRRTFWGDDTWYTRINLNGGIWHTRTTAGTLLDEGIWTSLSLNGPAQSDVWINPNLRREQFEGVTYRFPQLWFGGGLAPSGTFDLNVFANVGNAVDYANGRLADQFQITPESTVRIGPHIDLSLRYTFSRLSTSGRRIVQSHVSQFRGVYNFTPRTFVRAIVQYRGNRRDPDLYRDEVRPFEQAMLTQFLLSYKLNPQSVFFVGYGDSREGWMDVERTDVPLTQMNRSIFIKASYAWRP